jgi:transposase
MFSIGNSELTADEITRLLRESPLVPLRQMLPDREILAACHRAGYDTYRCRRNDPVVTVQHLLLQAIQREQSFAATCPELAAPLRAKGVGATGCTPAATSQARSRLPKAVLDDLVTQACQVYPPPVFERWQGYRLLALDATAVSMPDEPCLRTHFGVHRAKRTTTQYPLGSAAFLLVVGTSLLLAHCFGPFDPGEMSVAQPLLPHVGPGDLLLYDRHFTGSPFSARVRAKGADFLGRKNARLKVDCLPVLERLGNNDFITEIPMDKPARAKDPTLPATVRVRMFKAAWRAPSGEKVTEWFVTSLEDARRFKPAKLAQVYHQRWRVETSFLEFKQTFHADVLRSKTVGNIEKEFMAHVLAYQLVRRVMVQAARKHRHKPCDISFTQATRWVLVFSALMRAAPTAHLPALYQCLLDAVAGALIDVRPGRLEPRAVRRERKHYPYLRMLRSLWRQRRLTGLPELFRLS